MSNSISTMEKSIKKKINQQSCIPYKYEQQNNELYHSDVIHLYRQSLGTKGGTVV